MAKKPTISTISSGYYSRQALNTNFENLRDAFDNTLSLDGSTPNAMQADLDMNNNDILNAQEISTNGLRIDGVLIGSSDIAAAGASLYSDSYTGDGTTVAYTMSYQPFIKDNTQVYIDGVYQAKDGYSIAGTTLTFSEAPPLNSNIEIVVARSLDFSATDASNVGYTQGGTGSVNTTVESKLQETVSVKDFGAVGDGVTDDGAAFNAAIAAANGRTLDLGGYTYLISTQVSASCADGITIQNGRIVYDFASQVDGAFILNTGGQTRIVNLSIDGQDTAAKLIVVRSTNNQATLFVDNYYGKNAAATSATGFAAAFFVDEDVDPTDFFQSVEITNSRFTNVSATGTLVGRGLYVTSCNQLLVTNCHFEEIGPYQDGDGIFVTDATAFGTLRFLLSNCTFINCQKRAIKSQVANTRISNVIVRRNTAFTASAGQSDISLQDGGIIDGATCYFENGCAPTSIIENILRTQNNPFEVRNLTVVAEDPNDIVSNIVLMSQAEDIYQKNTIIENVQFNCSVDFFAEVTGEGLASGSKNDYVFDGVIFRNIKGVGFNPSAATDATSGQKKSGFIKLTRSSSSYVEIRYSMYNVKIGTDDTFPTTYLDTVPGSLANLTSTISEYDNVVGFDKKTYSGTGIGTFTSASVAEYVPNVQYNGLPNLFLSKSENIAENATYSQAFELTNDGSCKVAVLYGSRDTAGTRLYTEGFVVDGQGVTDYFESVAGVKSSVNTGAISITVTGANNQFTVAKTAGSTSGSGRLQVMIWHNQTVTEV